MGDRERFAALALRLVREMAPDREVDYDEDGFALRVADGDGEPAVVYLENVFRESEGGDLEAAIRGLAAPILSAEARDWPDARPRLRPVLRPVGFGLDTASATTVRPIRRPALPYLDEMVVVDEPTSMSYVTDAKLDEWGVTAGDVYAAARENLAGLVRVPANDTSGSLVSFQDPTGDAYHASWPLDRAWRTGLAARPVLFMAEHNSLMLVHAGTGSLAGIFKMIEDEYTEAVRPLSPVGYTVDGSGALVPYTVDADHPDAAVVGRAAAILASHAYGRQGNRLRREHEVTMEPAYIANLIVASSPAGRVFTAASWADGITTWMPRAEYVVLGPDRSLVPWATVEAEVGLTPVPGVDPPRYEVGGWPARDVLARLVAAAEEP